MIYLGESGIFYKLHRIRVCAVKVISVMALAGDNELAVKLLHRFYDERVGVRRSFIASADSSRVDLEYLLFLPDGAERGEGGILIFFRAYVKKCGSPLGEFCEKIKVTDDVAVYMI